MRQQNGLLSLLYRAPVAVRRVRLRQSPRPVQFMCSGALTGSKSAKTRRSAPQTLPLLLLASSVLASSAIVLVVVSVLDRVATPLVVLL